jgi:hypothetical protein
MLVDAWLQCCGWHVWLRHNDMDMPGSSKMYYCCVGADALERVER